MCLDIYGRHLVFFFFLMAVITFPMDIYSQACVLTVANVKCLYRHVCPQKENGKRKGIRDAEKMETMSVLLQNERPNHPCDLEQDRDSTRAIPGEDGGDCVSENLEGVMKLTRE